MFVVGEVVVVVLANNKMFVALRKKENLKATKIFVVEVEEENKRLIVVDVKDAVLAK
uniref:Candidate secreted effector n=1 Tax=Meloidogyne incognita TaxID=6306 RepID=A0A914KLA1_MELIC